MRKLFSLLFWTGAFVAANAALAGGIAAATLYDRLPTLREIADYRPRLPLRIYAGDGGLIAEFGEEKREFTPYQEFPRDLLNAVIATEDAKFFQHPGLDFAGIVRAALGYFRGRREGASTITMQVAGNFYLNRDRSLLYKISQILLALKIENQFAKEDILELYMNQIYLGAGAFGFAAAARVYYGKELDELTAPEIAVLAGLPQAPSRYHPGQSPELAKARQRHVLNRMLDTQLLTETEHRQLSAAELPPLAPRVSRFSVEAEFFAEEVRKIIYEGVTHEDNAIPIGVDDNGDGICDRTIEDHEARDFIGFGESTYQRGFRVYTTLDSDMQAAAVSALRSGLLAHESRRPYPGPEKFLDIKDLPREKILALLQKEKTVGDIPPAVILDVNKRAVLALTPDGEAHEIRGEGLARVRKHLPGGGGKPALARGAVVRVIESPSEKNDSESETPKLIKRVVSIPKAEAALVALSPEDGAILAMAGGFDFAKAKFNHATQARRQLGSSIKPFIYSAALEKGFMPSKILYDAPKHYSKEETGSDEFWEPRNYDRKDDGPIRMRVALNKSKNFATFDLMWALRESKRNPDINSIEPEIFNFNYVMDFIERFGFSKKDHPPYLSLALGPGASTPLETARAYAVFANGGLLHRPYFIRRVEDYDGNVLTHALPRCHWQAITERNAFMMTSMLRSVVRDGTGRGALSLERGDLAGKTGTTNDTRDAWFAGYGGGVVAVSWIGYDDHSIPLGKNETGGRAALPIWRDFMGAALAGRPEAKYAPPANVIAMDIRAADGEPAGPDDDDAISEYFYAEFLPSPPPDEEDEAEAVEELL